MSDIAIRHHLPRVLRDLTLSYLPDRELLPWIDEKDLDWNSLSRNPAAIHLIELHPNEINWECLSANPAAIHILEKNLDKVYWPYIARNPNAESIIKNNINKMTLYDLMRSPTCFRYCVDDQKEFLDDESGVSECIDLLYKNHSDDAFNILYQRDNHRISGEMYANPLAIQYLDYQLAVDIDWKYLSMNPAAIDILDAHPHRIDWYKLSKNPAAMRLLKANQDKIDWYKFSMNPGIFEPVPKSEIDTLL